MALEQHERLRDGVRALVPRRGAQCGDLTGADGLPGALVLARRLMSCEHLFGEADVTSQGSPYARLRRAIATGNAQLAWRTATELSHVDLEDALALVLLVVNDPRHSAAATRWLGRLCLEAHGVTLARAQLAADALAGLPDRAAAHALANLCAELGLARAATAARRAFLEAS